MSIKIVGITNCPVGVAHTYMAAEALKKEAEKRGYQIKIETQGSIGVENKLADEDIRHADYVIIAAGRALSDEELLRFDGKKLLVVDVSAAITKAGEIIDKLPEEAKPYKSNIGSGTSNGSQYKADRSTQGVFKHLMNGVSFMIPFITAGGILLAISTAMVGGGKTIPGTLPFLLEQVGVIGFQLMIPILAGYTAFSIGDKPSLAPAMIGAWLANQANILGTKGGGGFLGAIVVGLIVGYFVKWFKSIKVPKDMETLMPFLIIPTVTTLFISALIFYILGPFIAGIMVALTSFLNSLSGTSLFIVCAVIGIMIVADMGGPINKTAYLFALGMIPQGNAIFFGTVAITNVIPPVALGIATILVPRLFSEEEIANGRSSAVVGLFGITEPAIPYAVNDPVPVLSAQMIAAAVAGVIGAALRVTRISPGAGILDPIIGIVKPFWGYYLALAAGIVINTMLVIIFKEIKQRKALIK